MINQTTTCLVCFEDSHEQPFVKLKACSHSSCQTCITKWFHTCELSGRDSPSCPRCRQSVDLEETSSILGRQYLPFGKSNPNDIDESTFENEIDEFTLAALKEMKATKCGNCGAWIVREAGCRAMQCLCGFRFCMDCADVNGTADCICPIGSPGIFFDNTVRRELERRFPVHVATSEELLNMRVFIDYHRENIDRILIEERRAIELEELRRQEEAMECLQSLFGDEE